MIEDWCAAVVKERLYLILKVQAMTFDLEKQKAKQLYILDLET